MGVFNPNHHYYSPILQTRLWKVLKRHQSIVVLSQENVMNTDDKSFCCLLTWESPCYRRTKPCRLKRTSIRKNDFGAPPARLGRIGSRRWWLLPSAMDDSGHGFRRTYAHVGRWWTRRTQQEQRVREREARTQWSIRSDGTAALVRTTPRENDQLMELPLLSRCCRTANSNNCVHVPLREKGSEKTIRPGPGESQLAKLPSPGGQKNRVDRWNSSRSHRIGFTGRATRPKYAGACVRPPAIVTHARTHDAGPSGAATAGSHHTYAQAGRLQG